MESREPMKTKDPNDPRSAMRDLEWDNYYDSETRILHANWDEGFFSNCSTALWALADLAAEGIVPERISMGRGWDKYCDRSQDRSLDLYPVFFQRDERLGEFVGRSVSGRSWPGDHHRRYALTKIRDWKAFVDYWFTPSETVQKLERDISRSYEFDAVSTVGIFYRGTDKDSEVSISPVENYVEFVKFLLKDKAKYRIFIQTDQWQVRERFKEVFGNRCFALEEMPVTRGKMGLHFLPDEELAMDRIRFGMQVLSVTRMLAKCDTLINCTGNMAWWAALYRGNTEKMYQFDENSRFADPKGRDFTRNPLKRVVRSTKDFFRF